MEMEVKGDSQSLPSLPWKVRVLLSLLSIVTGATRRRNGTINRRLFNLVDVKAASNPNPVNGVKTSDVTVDPSCKLWFRVFVPTEYTGGDLLPVVVYFHGGGFAYFSANTRVYDALCRRLSREVGTIVVSVNYRLAPEHRYPAAYNDGFNILKFLDDNGHKVLPENADLSCCFLAGDSAGGNMAHHVAKRACQTQFQQIKVIGVVGIQSFFGGEERTESEKRADLNVSYLLPVRQTDWYWRTFLPAKSRDHEAINVSGPNAADISGLDFPATMVVVGGADVLQDWQRSYYQWLKRSGKEAKLVEYPNMVHGFYAFPEFPESGKLISDIRDFVLLHKYHK